jgi:hypothetical protein
MDFSSLEVIPVAQITTPRQFMKADHAHVAPAADKKMTLLVPPLVNKKLEAKMEATHNNHGNGNNSGTLSDSEAMMKANIDSMVWENGFDVIIICCSSGQQARYWQRRLDDNR